VPPLSPRLRLVRAALLLLAIVAGSLVVQLVVVSGVQHRAAQQQLFNSFRLQLAEGTAPVGPVDFEGRLIAPGSPVAFLEIPRLGVSEVVVSGTASGSTFAGPGHRRDTPLPGVAGTSVLLGRGSAYGGPFGRLDELESGDLVRVTTGQGVFEFDVLGVRREGDPVPPLPSPDDARLLLMTTHGGSFLPSGVLRVDAEATTPAVGGAAPLFTAATLPTSEQPMAADTSTMWALVLWLEGLVLAVLGFVWAWFRWSRAKAWVVFLPLIVVVGLATSQQAARLLPNML
jgi:sortase (surface protein transpeptidase)